MLNNKLTKYKTLFGEYIKHGDIIDVNQTINGCHEFIILCISEESPDIIVVYNTDSPSVLFYEYNIEELLQIDYIDCSGPLIIGNIFEDLELLKIKI